MITTVLFDLDGTLLPMDTDEFVKTYLNLMVRCMAGHGYAPKSLLDAIWKGIAAMTANDGHITNEDAFWTCFRDIFGEAVMEDLPLFEAFYREEFQTLRNACGYTPMAKQVLETCRKLGLRVALATNPLFPAIATHSRIRWAGLEPEDFSLVTTYDNSHASKPNLLYYREVLEALGVCPEECLMVGNDVTEDMIARNLGLRVFLLTPCLLNRRGEDIEAYPHGDFPELIAFLEELAHENYESSPN